MASSSYKNKKAGSYFPAGVTTQLNGSAMPIPGTSAAAPTSFAETREHLDGFHVPPPGTIHLSPGLPMRKPISSTSSGGSNYELGSSYVDSMAASPFASGSAYAEVLGGEWHFATMDT